MDSTGTDGKEPATAALSDNALRVRRVRSLTPAQREALGRLLPQLSPRLDGLAETQAARIVASPQTALLIAERGSELVGALTLVWYDVPSGRKAWIEDVVVDAAHRRIGAGRALVDAAVAEARRAGVSQVMLTSSPARTAARALYRKEGFETAETDVFALKIDYRDEKTR